MGKEELHFVTCFSAKQTMENAKEVLRLAFCGVLRRNKHALNIESNPNCSRTAHLFDIPIYTSGSSRGVHLRGNLGMSAHLQAAVATI